MRPISRLLSGALAVGLWSLLSVQPALACNGQDPTLPAGFRGATSIYYARIVGLQASTIGFYELTLDVGRVLRGTPRTHVTHMINAQVCTGLQVGDSGVVALGSKDPFGAGPKDTYNFFFVIGLGHANAADVNAAFLAAPETDTAPQAEGGGSSSRSSPAPLAIVALPALVLMLVLQRRRRGRTALSPSGPG